MSNAHVNTNIVDVDVATRVAVVAVATLGRSGAARAETTANPVAASSKSWQWFKTARPPQNPASERPGCAMIARRVSLLSGEYQFARAAKARSHAAPGARLRSWPSILPSDAARLRTRSAVQRRAPGSCSSACARWRSDRRWARSRQRTARADAQERSSGRVT